MGMMPGATFPGQAPMPQQAMQTQPPVPSSMAAPNLQQQQQQQGYGDPNQQYQTGPNGPNSQFPGPNGPTSQFPGQNGPNSQFGGLNQGPNGPNSQFGGPNQGPNGPNSQFGGPNQGPYGQSNSGQPSSAPPARKSRFSDAEPSPSGGNGPNDGPYGQNNLGGPNMGSNDGPYGSQNNRGNASNDGPYGQNSRAGSMGPGNQGPNMGRDSNMGPPGRNTLSGGRFGSTGPIGHYVDKYAKKYEEDDETEFENYHARFAAEDRVEEEGGGLNSFRSGAGGRNEGFGGSGGRNEGFGGGPGGRNDGFGGPGGRNSFGGGNNERGGSFGGNDRNKFGGGGNDRNSFGGGGPPDRNKFGSGGNDRNSFGGGGPDRNNFGGNDRNNSFGAGGNDWNNGGGYGGGGNDREEYSGPAGPGSGPKRDSFGGNRGGGAGDTFGGGRDSGGPTAPKIGGGGFSGRDSFGPNAGPNGAQGGRDGFGFGGPTRGEQDGYGPRGGFGAAPPPPPPPEKSRWGANNSSRDQMEVENVPPASKDTPVEDEKPHTCVVVEYNHRKVPAAMSIHLVKGYNEPYKGPVFVYEYSHGANKQQQLKRGGAAAGGPGGFFRDRAVSPSGVGRRRSPLGDKLFPVPTRERGERGFLGGGRDERGALRERDNQLSFREGRSRSPENRLGGRSTLRGRDTRSPLRSRDARSPVEYRGRNRDDEKRNGEDDDEISIIEENLGGNESRGGGGDRLRGGKSERDGGDRTGGVFANMLNELRRGGGGEEGRRERRGRSPYDERGRRERSQERERRGGYERDRECPPKSGPGAGPDRPPGGLNVPGRRNSFEDRLAEERKKYEEKSRHVEQKKIAIDDLLESPGRNARPGKIAIFLRGPPCSGKSFVAKIIKEKEAANGGERNLRILSLDDYFMTSEVEKEVLDERGQKKTVKTFEYEYEPELEESYRQSLLKSFKKNVTDAFFSFLIVDANNDQLSYYADMYLHAKSKGFAVYIVETSRDVGFCLAHNERNRSEQDIRRIVGKFQSTPREQTLLDITSLLQEVEIEDVEMEDVSNEEESQDGGGGKGGTETVTLSGDEEDDDDIVELDGGSKFTIPSKWDNIDHSIGEIKAKLDGLSKKSAGTIRDWLNDDNDELSIYNKTRGEKKSGKKQVRWADIEEKYEQDKMKAIGFIVGGTDWSRMMDPNSGEKRMNQTKYI
uniref:YLP motif-containing protein 1 n=1 Tax=Cacopsylla melanoneura TaxID=428564 RepID=A0A8D8U2Z2_9HEMI